MKSTNSNNTPRNKYFRHPEVKYSVEPNQYLSAEIEFSLARIFERELQLIDEFFEISSEIKQSDFNVYQAFRQIDYLNSNNLDENK